MQSKFKKILRISIPIIGVGFVGGILTLASGCLINKPIVSIGGSTAVLSLINAIANNYNDMDIVTSAGGSGVGISSIINGTKEIGMASKDPKIIDLSPENNDYKIWNEKNIKTLTIAWDGIGLVYKPSLKSSNEELIINEESLAKIYHIFSGNKEFTFNELFENNDNSKIIPFSRNGGGEVSGTTDAFFNDSHLKYTESNYWKSLNTNTQSEIENSIKKGSYGKYTIETAESNSQAWDRVKKGGEGAITYLSAGFILNNEEEIKKAGFKIAKYKDTNGTLISENITKTYNWYRPFNLIFSINHIKNSTPIIQMLENIIFNFDSTIIKEGYVTLTKEQKMSMGFKDSDKQFFIKEQNSDIKLGHCGAL